jgi:hypothetical protein
MCGDRRAALRCPGWPQATARAARSGLDSTRRAAWHRAECSPLRFVVGPGIATTNWLTFFLAVEAIRRNAWTGTLVASELVIRVRHKLRGVRGSRVFACPSGLETSSGVDTAEHGPRSALRELRLSRVRGRDSSRFSISLAIREAQEHLCPAARAVEISRPPPPSQAPGPISQKISLLARHNTASWEFMHPPSLQAVCPNGTKTNLGEHIMP